MISRSFFTLAFLYAFISYAHIATADEIESHTYLKTIGKKSEKVQWCVQKSETFEMLYSTKRETSLTKTDQKMSTILWSKINSAQKTNLSALRKEEEIHIKGVFKGEPVDKKVMIDKAPWYQATSWSLRNFILSEEQSKEFWMLRTTTLKPYKVLVKKIGEETMADAGQTQTIKAELRIQGFLSHFWKSNYWFRKSDGVFIRFEGASGPPGAPLAVVEYLNQTSLCKINIANLAKNSSQSISTTGDI